MVGGGGGGGGDSGGRGYVELKREIKMRSSIASVFQFYFLHCCTNRSCTYEYCRKIREC